MDILGSIGKLYTFLLLVVLFLGSGFAVWAGINAIMNKREVIKENTIKIKENLNLKFQNINNKDIIGGLTMKNNGLIKLAVFSFVGIIISAAILTALPKSGNSMGYMNTQNMVSMNMQGSVYGQSGMQGMTNYNLQGTMNGNADFYSIQQQLNNIQQQIYQLQNQMNNNSMNGMQSNSGSSMNNMGNSMNNMGSSRNNMGNSNNMNNNMNNNSSMNNMNNSNSNSSSMSMM